MPALADHLLAADNNRLLAMDLLTRPQFIVWSPVLSFYSALRMVDSYLAAANVHPRSHAIRRAYVERDPALESIRRDYRFLERRSREARYDLVPFETEEARSLLEVELSRVTTVIRALLPSGA